MFGRKQQEERAGLKAALAEIKGAQELQRQAHQAQAEALREQAETLRELGRELAACREQVDLSGKDTGKQLKRHSEAIEDLLEDQGTQEAVIKRYEQQVKESGEREDMLLALLCRYQEEFGLIEDKLRTMGQQGEGWADQLALFRKSLEGSLRQCAITETGRPGEPLDYRYHEILDVEDTEEQGLDGTVAHCYRPGCLYHGRVVTKAQVKAYRRKKGE